MSLTLVKIAGESLVCPFVLDGLRSAVEKGGEACVLAPSFDHALRIQRELAARGIALGVRVTTPSAWIEERWGLWGDGRRLVDGAAREIVCARIVASAASEGIVPADNEGTRSILSGLVRAGLRRLAEDPSVPEGVSEAEAAVVSLCAQYSRELTALGLIEECEAAHGLPGRLAAGDQASLFFVGFSHMPAHVLSLAAALSATREVTVACEVGASLADAPARALLGALREEAEKVGAPVETVDDAPEPESRLVRSPEVQALADAVFCSDAAQVSPSGAVKVLLPAGPSAEDRLIADEVAKAASEGAARVAIVATDPERASRELVPRLVARGISVRMALRRTVSALEEGRAFLEFAREVARLDELAAQWPEGSRALNGAQVVKLGDMSWWPPRELSDFLASHISGLDPARARALDREWRANRLLTPQAVLDKLRNEKATSPAVAQATRELLRGRIGSAASKLLAPFVDGGADSGDLVRGEASVMAKAALAQVLSVAKSLKECGLTVDPEVERRVSLVELVDIAASVLGRVSASARLRWEAPGSACEVLIARPNDELAPAAFDRVFICGMTSAESPIKPNDSVLASLLDSYGVQSAEDALPLERHRFRSLLRAARDGVSLERCLYSADSKECYPSVMMTEALACYGIGDAAKASAISEVLGERNVVSAGETCVGRNRSVRGVEPGFEGTDAPMPAGRISPALRSCVTPPPEGRLDAVPVLSASQIESYLECPYKWFSQRRLRLRDADAGFTGAEMGTFAHRVLEVTHRNLLALAQEKLLGASELRRIYEEDPEGMQSAAYAAEAERLVALAQGDPTALIAGSRPVAGSPSLELARKILDEEFGGHLDHQYFLGKGKRPQVQALVPHTAGQAGSVDALRRDLLDLIDYESKRFTGYEPRFFEWGFGKHNDVVEYAGVRITGTVDRIDVDAHGQAAVIDYKHKGDRGFAAEYDAFGKEGAGDAFELPRRVQSLIYGQVVRRAFPGLKVRAAVYLCTKGSHEIAGAVDAEAVDAVFGPCGASKRRLPRIEVPRAAGFGMKGESGMDALLDACEEAIAAKLERLLAGDIEANPIDAHACDYCPVLNCERRLSK